MCRQHTHIQGDKHLPLWQMFTSLKLRKPYRPALLGARLAHVPATFSRGVGVTAQKRPLLFRISYAV